MQPAGFEHKKRSWRGPDEQAEGKFRVLRLDEYEGGFQLWWEAPAGTVMPSSVESMGLAALSIRDDVGTAYAPVATSGGVGKGWTKYSPAIPSEAAWLDLLTNSEPVRFGLQKPE